MVVEGDVRGMRAGSVQRTADRSDMVDFEAIG